MFCARWRSPGLVIMACVIRTSRGEGSHGNLRSLGASLGRPLLLEVLALSASRGSCVVDAEDGPYQAIDGATPWAEGRQVWVPQFLEH